ncbi:MAG: amidase [Dehalococcoidia bacterium]
MGNELWRLGAADLATLLRNKEVKSREVVEAHLARIAAVNPGLNAVTLTLNESALAAADAADDLAAKGGSLPPLHGVPISVKENIDLLGSATTQGIVSMAEALPTLDAPHVAQIKAAGAIPFARTNMPDFGMRWHSDNGLRGATLNPWDRSRTPGGSSGGEAVALATGMTPLGLGNDYGGSLRWPSQCNGTAALRPTLGRVPSATSFEPADSPITLQLFAVQGPMARHVRDLRLALELMSAPDARDPWYTPAVYRGPAVPRRVACCADPGGLGVDPDVAAGVAKAAAALREAGYEVEDVELPAIEAARDTWYDLVMSELEVGLLPLLQQVACPDALQFLGHSFSIRPRLDLAGYMMGFAQRSGIARAWTEFHERYPLVLGPVATIQPFPVGHDLAGSAQIAEILNGLRLVVLANLLGLPVAVVPVGVSNGLPQGVQLIADRYREDLCLAAAEEIEDRLGVVTPIDPV